MSRPPGSSRNCNRCMRSAFYVCTMQHTADTAVCSHPVGAVGDRIAADGTAVPTSRQIAAARPALAAVCCGFKFDPSSPHPECTLPAILRAAESATVVIEYSIPLTTPVGCCSVLLVLIVASTTVFLAHHTHAGRCLAAACAAAVCLRI